MLPRSYYNNIWYVYTCIPRHIRDLISSQACGILWSSYTYVAGTVRSPVYIAYIIIKCAIESRLGRKKPVVPGPDQRDPRTRYNIEIAVINKTLISGSCESAGERCSSVYNTPPERTWSRATTAAAAVLSRDVLVL